MLTILVGMLIHAVPHYIKTQIDHLLQGCTISNYCEVAMHHRYLLTGLIADFGFFF
jgi:hypothetical protein